MPPPPTDKRLDFEPSKWGPHAWAFLHAITYSYPENPRPELQHQMRTFFEGLQVALPCAKCRDNYSDKFERTAGSSSSSGDPFRSRTALTRWLREMHNDVNASHSKPAWDEPRCTATYTRQDQLCGTGGEGGGGARRARARRGAWVLLAVLLLLCVIGSLLLWQTCSVCY